MPRPATNPRPTSAVRTVEIDMTGVEGRQLIPEGDYLGTVKNITEGEGDNGAYWRWTFATSAGTPKPMVTSFTPKSLFKLKNLLIALGHEVPSGRIKLDPAKYIGESCGITISFSTYDGVRSSEIVDVFDKHILDEVAAIEGEGVEGESQFKIGTRVTFDYKGNQTGGVIKDIDEEDDEITVQPDGSKKTIVVSADELELEVDEEEEEAPPTPEVLDDEAEVEVGSKVSFTHKGQTVTGEVTEIDEEEESITVKVEGVKRPIILDLNDESLVLAEE